MVRGTIESTSRYSAGRVVVAADRPEAVEARDAHARGRVRVGGAAGRGVARPRSRARSATASACSTSRPLRSSFSIGHQRGHRRRSRRSCRGPRSRAAIARISASAASSASRGQARTSTSSPQRSATTLGRVPPAITPTLTVTPGHRPLRSCRSRTIRAASRIALRPFSGSTPAWAARPLTVDAQVADALARRDDVAVGAGTLEDERRHRRPRRRSGCAASTSASRSPRPGWRRTSAARTAGRRPRR